MSSSFSSSAIDNVGSALYSESTGRQALAAGAINRGATAAQAKDYGRAVQEFRRAAAYDTTDPNAYRYMGQVYRMMNQPDDAIDAYKKALMRDPQNADAKNELASVYIEQKKYDEAEKLLKEIMKTDATNAGPPTTLGFLYLNTGRYAEADTQFTKVAHLAPTSGTAQYNLGLLRNKEGKYDEAIGLFQKALTLSPKSENAHADLAFAYLGLGRVDDARQQFNQLINFGTSTGNTLAAEVMHEINTPKFLYSDPALGNFSSVRGPDTPVSALDASLATPGASKVFRMAFTFNQPMDPSSVMNALNWQITEGTGGTAGAYNYGVSLHPGQDAHVAIAPLAVNYDPYSNTAVVYFRVSQNAAGDALIDPSHLVFKFSGVDAYGRSMDKSGDEYDGHAITPF